MTCECESSAGAGAIPRRLHSLGLGVAHLDQYFGVWAVKEDVLRAAVDRVSGMDLGAHVAAYAVDVNEPPLPPARLVAATGSAPTHNRAGYWVSDGVAVVEIVGVMSKYGSSLSTAGASVRIRQAVRAAGRDDAVRAIVLVVDSPGGTVAGTRDLAEEIARAATMKPVLSFGEDMVASAAYWAASQATKLYVNASAVVGSIGTFAVLQDDSVRAERLGIKVHVVRAGEFKGSGVPGTPVTPAVLDETQALVDALNAQFLEAVSRGRRLSMAKVQQLADGRVHVGAAAVALGLADGVATFEQVMLEAGKQAAPAKARPATVKEKRAAAIAAFDSAVRAKMTKGGMERSQAVRAVALSRPELHRRYIAATNRGRN